MSTATSHSHSVKAFVKDDGTSAISCPACSIIRHVSVAKFRHQQHVLSVKCKCGVTFKVHLEFRKHYRKQTKLEGYYSMIPPGAGGGRITVTNISRSGVGFSVSGTHLIKPEQIAQLKFTLDNRKATELDKRVEVKCVKGNYIGCTFVDQQAFEKELGFYLRP